MDAAEVWRARLKELNYIDEKHVWARMTRQEALDKNIKIIGTRWVDVNKGDFQSPVYRSRLVAKEFNTRKDMSIFAATPPLEALRFLISEAATVGKQGEMGKVVMVCDVARAFFEAEATRLICVELPSEAKTKEDEDNDNVAVLLKRAIWD